MKNNAYLDASWFNGDTVLSDDQINDYIWNLQDHKFNVHLCDVGVISDTGKLLPEGYSHLGRWINIAKYFTPKIHVVPVLNYGRRKMNPNFGSTTFNKNLNNSIKTLFTQFNLEGIHLDIEGFIDQDLILLNTLKLLKTNSLKSKSLSISTPATTWSSEFISKVANAVNEINPMIYDCMGWGSDVVDCDSYQSHFKSVILTYSKAIAGISCELAPTLPCYDRKVADDSTVYHDHEIESVSAAINGLNDAIQQGAKVSGAGIFWWPMYNGLYPDSYSNYTQDQEAWMNKWLKL